MKLATDFSSKSSAEKFAKDLKLQGAKGVQVKKHGKHYRVQSTLLSELNFGDFSNLNFKEGQNGNLARR